MDKNNLPLILKSLSFVSQRPAPYNGTLCGSFLPGPAQPGFFLPASGRRQEEGLSSRVRENFGQPNVAVGHHSEAPTQRGEPKEENKQNRQSWKMLSPLAGRTAFAAYRCSQPALCPMAAATAGRARSRQGGLGTQSPAPGRRGWETDSPVSADKPSRVLTMNASLLLVQGIQEGKSGLQRKEKETFLSCSFKLTNSSHLHNT